MERTELTTSSAGGTKDGSGAADNDQPYRFGRRPRAVAPWPFTERQYAHLLILRGRLADQPNPADRADAHPIAFLKDGVWVASQRDLVRKPRRKAA
jgi:hypothetical protein